MVELLLCLAPQALVSAGEPAVPVDDRHKWISRASAFDAQRCLPAALVGARSRMRYAGGVRARARSRSDAISASGCCVPRGAPGPGSGLTWGSAECPRITHQQRTCGDAPIRQQHRRRRPTACTCTSPQVNQGERRDSNPRQPAPQAGALPAELRPPCPRVGIPPLRVPTSLTDRRGADARPGRAPVAGSGRRAAARDSSRFRTSLRVRRPPPAPGPNSDRCRARRPSCGSRPARGWTR